MSIFTTVTIVLIFIFNSKMKKVFHCYYFYLIISIAFLFYFVFARWLPDLKRWLNNDSSNYYGGMSVVISKVLLLDMCPFGSVALSLLMIFDKKRNVAAATSFFGIIGGAISIYGQIQFEGIQNCSWTWINNVPGIETPLEYIFGYQIYFSMHYYLLIMSIIVLLNSDGFNWKKIGYSHAYAVVFYTYITIMVYTLNVEWNATGIVKNDWGPMGEYVVIGKIINLPWPWQPIVVFSGVWLLIIALIWLRNMMILDNEYITKNMVINWNAKHKYINFLVEHKMVKQ